MLKPGQGRITKKSIYRVEAEEWKHMGRFWSNAQCSICKLDAKRHLCNTWQIYYHMDAKNDLHPTAGTAIYSQIPTPRSWHEGGSLFLLLCFLHLLILFWPACNYFLHLSVQGFRFLWSLTCLLQVRTTLKSLPTLQ